MFETPIFTQELNRIADELVAAYRKVLEEQDKIATGKTAASIRAQTQPQPREIGTQPLSISVFGAEGIFMIEKGREAFEVLLEDDDPDLLEWMDARNIPRSAVRGIASSIYFNPLPPIPITGIVVEEKLDQILQRSNLAGSIAADAAAFLRRALQVAFQNSKTIQP